MVSRIPSAVLAAVLAVLAGCGGEAEAPSQAQARDEAAACAAIAAGVSIGQTQVMGATRLPAEGDVPARCEVQAVIRPVEGSEIGVVYRLPDNWNGKLLALGGGGWMGNVTPQAAAQGLGSGYATLQTDAGHATGTAFDASEWALLPDGTANQTKLEDFSHRAIHEMTVRGKELIAAHYGKPASRAYYQGCSTGGRMGLMEVQRYPEDFDGVIAGAPVYTLQTQTSAQLRSLVLAAPGARMLPQHLGLIQKAVLAACDEKDGAADGVLRDPRACDFNPGVLQCKAAQSGESCLTSPQVAALRKLYAGQKSGDGAVAAYPLEKGSESLWVRFVPSTEAGDPGANSGGMYALRGPLLGNSDFDLGKFKPDDVPKVRSSWLASVYEAGKPDISAFTGRGGKLILWHGSNDPGPSARGTIEYYDAALAATPAAAESVRLFLAPGVGHCRGGDGPDDIDWLAALDSWVDRGVAPAELPATKAESALAWNVCAWPALPTGQPGGGYACK